MFKKTIHWLVASSANPNDLSLSIKGVLVMYAPAIVFGFGLIHLPIDASAISAIIDAFVAVIQAGLILIGAAMTLIGLVRKVTLTLAGRNVAAEQIAPTPTSPAPGPSGTA